MDNVSEQNFKAIQNAFNEMKARLDEQELKMRGLEGTIAEIKGLYQEATQHLQVLRAITGGTGPTTRS